MSGEGMPDARFDWQGYIAETTRSEKERLQEQIEAKYAQTKRRQELYEDTVATLQSELSDVEQQLSGCGPTRERRDRLHRRQNRLQRDLHETRERFASDMQRLEDAVLELEAELEKVCEAEELLEEAVTR